MHVHLDFSIFLLDGFAFGKAAYDSTFTTLPRQGDSLSLLDLAPQFPVRDVDKEAFMFADSVVGRLAVINSIPFPADSSGSRFLVEIDDVVLDSPATAHRLISLLESLGFDCDVWAKGKGQ
jgi:hypothetical protein